MNDIETRAKETFKVHKLPTGLREQGQLTKEISFIGYTEHHLQGFNKYYI